MNTETNDPTKENNRKPGPRTAAETSTVNIEVDAVTRRLQAAKRKKTTDTHILYHAAKRAAKRALRPSKKKQTSLGTHEAAGRRRA